MSNVSHDHDHDGIQTLILTTESEAFPSLSFILHAHAYFIHLKSYIFAIICSNPFQTLPSFIMPTLLREPAHALFQRQRTQTQTAGEEQLQTDRYLPLLSIGIVHASRNSVIDQVRRENTQRKHQLVEASHLPSDLFGDHLG